MHNDCCIPHYLSFKDLIPAKIFAAFDPLRIRLGGSLQDQIIYQFGSQKECPTMRKKDDGLFGFSVGCLPKKRWDEVNELFNKTGYYFLTLFLNMTMHVTMLAAIITQVFFFFFFFF